jgi:hypothetical protein
VIPSAEYLALKALGKPARSQAGDMWLCRRLGIIRVFNGHKRGSRKGTFSNNFHLYHWGKPSLRITPCDWRDDDPQSNLSDPSFHEHGERWEYLGNIFDMLPYSSFANAKEIA